MIMKLNALGKCLLGLPLALICGIALACVIIGWINIWWQLDEYMRKSKEDANPLIQEAEDLVSRLDQGAEGDGEWNPNRQMTQQIVDSRLYSLIRVYLPKQGRFASFSVR